MPDLKCKKCRRAGTKLFLKGDKCFSAKCPVLRKPYAPGQKGKRRTRALSEYGKELREKQRLKNWYNLRERQFAKYVKIVLGSRHKVENAEVMLIRLLESRLDNVVFRLGFSVSRDTARQITSHRHFLVNGKPVNIPSFNLKKGNTVSLSPKSVQKEYFKKMAANLKHHKAPSWLSFDAEKMEGKVVGEPTIEEASPPAELLAVFEFYSR